MSGRLENDLHMKKITSNLLADLPDYVSDFYYSMMVSKEQSTCAKYISLIHRFYKYNDFPDVKWIDDIMVSMYFDHISYSIDNDGKVNQTTFSYKKITWTALNALFSYLQEKGVMQKNPMRLIGRPKTMDDVQRKFIEMDDMKKMLALAKREMRRPANCQWGLRDYLILLLFLCTGMRRSALVQIDVADISFDDMTIKVTDKRNKTIYYDITDDLAEVILDWLDVREELLGKAKCDALFISKNLQRISGKSVLKIVGKYSEKALGDRLTPHKLRAAFGQEVYRESGNDIRATQEAMNHGSISTTSLYIVRKSDTRKRAVQHMSNSLI